jgi:hypothetical protein
VGVAFLGAAPGGGRGLLVCFPAPLSNSQELALKLAGRHPGRPHPGRAILQFPVRTHHHHPAAFPGQHPFDHLVGPLPPPGIDDPHSPAQVPAFLERPSLPTVKDDGDLVLGTPLAVFRKGGQQGLPARLQVPGIQDTQPRGLADERKKIWFNFNKAIFQVNFLKVP